MKVEIAKSALKSLNKIPKKFKDPIDAILSQLKQANDFSEINCEKLRGHADRYKIRRGDYRIVLKKIANTHIQITAIADRKDIYNGLFEFLL